MARIVWEVLLFVCVNFYLQQWWRVSVRDIELYLNIHLCCVYCSVSCWIFRNVLCLCPCACFQSALAEYFMCMFFLPLYRIERSYWIMVTYIVSPLRNEVLAITFSTNLPLSYRCNVNFNLVKFHALGVTFMGWIF